MAICPEERLPAVPPEATEFISAEYHPPPRHATARHLILSPPPSAAKVFYQVPAVS